MGKPDSDPASDGEEPDADDATSPLTMMSEPTFLRLSLVSLAFCACFASLRFGTPRVFGYFGTGWLLSHVCWHSLPDAFWVGGV